MGLLDETPANAGVFVSWGAVFAPAQESPREPFSAQIVTRLSHDFGAELARPALGAIDPEPVVAAVVVGANVRPPARPVARGCAALDADELARNRRRLSDN